MNSLLHLSSNDQLALLDVLEDYFTTPCETGSEDSEVESESEIEAADLGTFTIISK